MFNLRDVAAVIPVNVFGVTPDLPAIADLCPQGGMEAIDQCSKIVGRPMSWSYSEQNRLGDHIAKIQRSLS